jgi:hypothetical protein
MRYWVNLVLALATIVPSRTLGFAPHRVLFSGIGGKQPIKASTARQSLLKLRGGDEILKKAKATILAGKLLPFLSKLAITPSNAGEIYYALTHYVDLREFAVIVFLAWALKPCAEFLYEKWQAAKGTTELKFEGTQLYHFVKTVAQAATIGLFIYGVDCFAIILNTMGFKYLQQMGFSHKAANVSFILWIASCIRDFKRYLIFRAFMLTRNKHMEKAKVYDQIFNFLLYFFAAAVVIDHLSLDFGVMLSSLFAFGGVGTLVFSLASKDLASQLVSGLALSTSDRFREGDEVKLEDGTSGKLTKLGLLYSDIRGEM